MPDGDLAPGRQAQSGEGEYRGGGPDGLGVKPANRLRRPAAARSIGSHRAEARRSDVTVTAVPPAGRAGACRTGARRRAGALVGLPAGHKHRRRARARDQQPDFPGAPRAAALRAAGQRVPVCADVRAEHRILRRLRQDRLPFRVQDVLAALYNSAALGEPDWQPPVAAFLSARRLEPAEVAALPELLIARAPGSALWRVARWRAGLGRFAEVTAHVGRLEAATRRRAANRGALLSVAAAANAGA